MRTSTSPFCGGIRSTSSMVSGWFGAQATAARVLIMVMAVSCAKAIKGVGRGRSGAQHASIVISALHAIIPVYGKTLLPYGNNPALGGRGRVRHRGRAAQLYRCGAQAGHVGG